MNEKSRGERKKRKGLARFHLWREKKVRPEPQGGRKDMYTFSFGKGTGSPACSEKKKGKPLPILPPGKRKGASRFRELGRGEEGDETHVT